jgi:hypothetical protein
MSNTTKIMLLIAAAVVGWWIFTKKKDAGNGQPTGSIGDQLDATRTNFGAPDLFAAAGTSPKSAGSLTIGNSVSVMLAILALTIGTAFAQDRPGAITSAANTTNAAGVFSISSREISIGTNTAVASLPQIVAVPSASTNALPNTNLTYLVVSGTNVYFGRANAGGTGTNWIKITGAPF